MINKEVEELQERVSTQLCSNSETCCKYKTCELCKAASKDLLIRFYSNFHPRGDIRRSSSLTYKLKDEECLYVMINYPSLYAAYKEKLK